jgi:hypothetical protein
MRFLMRSLMLSPMRSLTRSPMRSFAVALASIVAAGCSSMRAHEVGALLDPYVGRPASAVVDRFGPPSGNYASSAVTTTYQWDNFGGPQLGMPGCRVLVVAKRSSDEQPKALGAFGSDPIGPGEYWKWTVESWSSFGSGCR